MPIFHRRTRRGIFFFIVDKARDRLSGWDVRKLSFAARLTLVKLVLLSIPNFFMTTARLPISTCKEIEKIARQFVWGCSNGVKRVALVKWTDLCKHVERGGFGIRSLKDQNLVFFLKLGYKLVTNTDALWVTILRNKYNIHGLIP